DRRRRGGISFDEFRLALYTCDPKNPDRMGGFASGQSLAPKDLLEMFDKDEEGAIDRGTFVELLEFIGHKLPLDKMEELFATYEDVGGEACCSGVRRDVCGLTLPDFPARARDSSD
ncbi:hypothetical protein PF006_g33560, partial [Phytophthora fragariae]